MNLQIGVKVLIRNNNDQFLLIQRSAPLDSDASISWDIPGGRIESHESLETALSREVKEEIGHDLTTNPRLLTAQDIFVAAKDLHVVRLTYLAHETIEAIRLSAEHENYTWASLSETKSMTIEPYLRSVLDEIVE